MSRISFLFVTLIAAVPAALLAAVLVMGFLNHFERISGAPALMVVSGLTLLAAVAVVATPVLAFLGGRDAALKPSGADDEPADAASGEVAVADDEAEPADFGESEEVVSEDEDVFVAGEDDDFADFDDDKKK